jgi:ankyrin repeat protein
MMKKSTYPTSFMPSLSHLLAFVCLCLAGVATPAWAQTASNPSVNAQLLVAARNADAEGVKKSLDRGAMPNSRNRLGKTSLYLSVEKNRIDIGTMLIAAGADVNMPSLEKVTPLIAASYAGSLPFVDLLLKNGAKHEPTDRLHKSALVYAAGMGHTAVVERLLQAGAPVDETPVDALTPLMWAAGQGHMETVKLLLAKGANKLLKDDRGLTAMDMAKEANHAAIVSLLQ